MNTKITINEMTIRLAEWICELKEAAKKDSDLSISWFKETETSPFSIVGGWMEGFSEAYSDILCISKSEPKYAMCVKIVINEKPYAYVDFETLDMPYDRDGFTDDTCITLEWDDNPVETARFFLMEWERIMEEHKEEI